MVQSESGGNLTVGICEEPLGDGVAVAATALRRYLEYREGNSEKFWEITLDNSPHTVRFGRLGSEGQSLTRSFPDDA